MAAIIHVARPMLIQCNHGTLSLSGVNFLFYRIFISSYLVCIVFVLYYLISFVLISSSGLSVDVFPYENEYTLHGNNTLQAIRMIRDFLATAVGSGRFDRVLVKAEVMKPI